MYKRQLNINLKINKLTLRKLIHDGIRKLSLKNNQWITPRKESGCLEGIMVSKALKLKIVKEELISPEFQNDDIIVAINSLSCRQIYQVDDLKLKPKFDPIYFWDLLYS